LHSPIASYGGEKNVRMTKKGHAFRQQGYEGKKTVQTIALWPGLKV